MFVLSKIPEFIDTIFILLRKQPLIFLHWYHHLSVVLFVWYTYSETVATTRWYTTMNYFVHSVMYSYYSLKAMQYKVPKSVAVMITMLRIMQMIMGSTIATAAYYYRESGHFECYMSQEDFSVCYFVYFSYLVLFVKFFYKSYLSGKRTAKDEKIRFVEIAIYANKKTN